MARNRKLGRPTDQRLAMLKCLTTDLILHGKIQTTQNRAKEVKAIADSIIALAVKEKDNFEMVDVKVVTAKLDSKGNKETVKATSKNGNMPTRLNASKKIMRMINKVKDENGKNIDLPGKLFNEIAPKYADRVGGYTRIIKLGQRRGDAAPIVILELI